MKRTRREPSLGFESRVAEALEAVTKEERGTLHLKAEPLYLDIMLKPIAHLLPSRYQKKDPRHPEQRPEALAAVSASLRSEVNGLVYPFFYLTKAGGPESIETRMRRKQGDQTIEAVWRVTPHPASGRPGPLAHRVHRAVEQLVTERGLPASNPVPFSIYDLCRRMGIQAGGTEYRKVKAALVAIRGTQVESKGMFYSKSQSQYVDQVFSLYDRLIFTGERLADGTIAEQNLLYLGTWYLESLNSLYVKPLDYRFYLHLQTPISRRLYELLGVKFYRVAGRRDAVIRYRYSTLCRLLPVKRHTYRSRVRQQLGAAHEELMRGAFLESAWDTPVPHQPDWYVWYRPGPKALEEIRVARTKKTYRRQDEKNGAHSSGLRGGRHDAG